ncbi:MAG TPA: 30S ribosome-binding factor RbfA [Candidatus Obscuribacterales bacterium]
MSTPRKLRVAQSAKKELSELIRRDLKDDRVAGIVSITDIEASDDCRRMRVFVSVFGDEQQQEGTLAALNDHVGEIRGELGRRLRLRFAPELSFKLDNSLERGARVTDLLGKIARGEV